MFRSAVAMAVTAASLVGVGGSSISSAAPPGFADELVVSTGTTLTAVEALPDGRVVVLEQTGTLRRLDDRDGSVEQRVMATFPVCTNSERGLLGFALDPAYVTSGFVYVYYTLSANGGCQNRVSRYFMNEDGLDLTSEFVLVDKISSAGGNHNGGDIEIGNDGFLYIAVGDAGADPRGNSGAGGSNDAAQDRSLLNGKILRVQRSNGVAAPGNPFTGTGTADCRLRGNDASTPSTICREIFAYGLRNPYRFAFDPNTSATRFFINDVGQSTYEEVNLGARGANYGWPTREGRCPQGQTTPCAGPASGLTDPVSQYGRSAGGFITGGAFVPAGVWPAAYDGGFLASDGSSGTTWLMTNQAVLSDAPVFLTASAPTDMVFVTGPSSTALWYVQQNGQVRKVSPPISTPVETGALHYEPLDAIDRRFDTRTLDPRAPLVAGRTQLIDLEAPTGARAALVNITLLRPLARGAYLTIWEPGTSRPQTATVNGDQFEVTANASIVPLDDDGRVLAFAQATTDVIIDVAGFFVPADDAVREGRMVVVEPQRLIDTREQSAPDNDYTRVDSGDGEVVTVNAVEAANLTALADIEAVVVTVTGIQADSGAAGFATLYASGATRPLASNVNVNPGSDVRANLAVVPINDDGSIDIYLERVRNVAIDITGYVTDPSAQRSDDGRFHLVAPTREVDTRSGQGFAKFGAKTVRTLNPGVVRADASAVAQNLTMVRTGGRGFVSAYPGSDRPTVSSVNASGAGQIRGAFGVVSLESGSESLYSEAASDLTVDVLGWFE